MALKKKQKRSRVSPSLTAEDLKNLGLTAEDMERINENERSVPNRLIRSRTFVCPDCGNDAAPEYGKCPTCGRYGCCA